MRLPFPERIPVLPTVLAASLLVGLQQLQGTSLPFSIYTFLFIVIATFAFNLAGGFTRPSGSYVFFYAVLGLIVGLVYKAYLGEPADTNLRSPILTMQVFCGGITSMLAAVFIAKKITRRRPFLGSVLKERDMRTAAIGSLVFGMGLNVINLAVPHQNGSILSAVSQLNRFLQMSVVISTLYAIRSSKGKSGISILVVLTVGLSLAYGTVSFSKEGIFTPIFCWLVAACSMRLRVRPYQVVLTLLVFYMMGRFLVPYSQYGRNLIPENATLGNRITIALSLLSDLGSVRSTYIEGVSSIELNDDQINLSYYNKTQGFVDRLTMIGPDDVLINYTSQGNFAGFSAIPIAFANWIPHFLYPNKTPSGGGNAYAHEIGGILGDEDTTTGISFSPTSDAYHLGGWVGIFIVAPLIWIMLFALFDSVCGDCRDSPWGLLAIALFAHVAPEGQLGGAIYIMWYGAVGIVAVALATAYVMPLIGSILAGADKTGFTPLRTTLRPRNNVPRKIASSKA